MSGAYVAKPDVIPESEAPPGWGLWPWPGPFPPGFSMEDLDEFDELPEKEYDSNGDEIPRILVYPKTGLTTRESDNGNFVGTNNSLFYVVLTVSPKKGAMTVPVTSRDTSEGTAGNYGIVLEFQNTQGDWDRPRAIDLRGIMDDIEDGDVGYTIKVGPSESSHVDYDGLFGSDVSVTNIETVWELRVTAALTTSTSIGASLSWPTGFSQAVGWFEVRAPKGTARVTTTDYIYMHPDEGYHTVTTVIIGQPETFEIFSKTFVLATTGRNKVTFDIAYKVTVAGQNAQEFIPGGGWFVEAKSSMVIYIELLRDGVVQSTDTETVTAEITMPGFDIDSGEAHFLTDEGF